MVSVVGEALYLSTCSIDSSAPANSKMKGLSSEPVKPTRAPAGGKTITSPGSKRVSAATSPDWMNLYRSMLATLVPARTRSTLRMEPEADGPPLSKIAPTNVDRLDTM